MKKWAFILFTLTAVIRSSELRSVGAVHRIPYTRLCANYDVQRNGQTIEQSYQCGDNWNDIEKGIRYQLQYKQEREDAMIREANRIRHLQDVKNDEIGKVIHP